MDSLAALAEKIATEAHAGQVDKAGAPYIGHPTRVAARVAAAGYDDRYVAVAFLHDVIEDTPLTFDDLLAAGFPADVVAGVDSVTKRKGESNVEATHRAGANEYGRVVKPADVGDNCDPDRLALLDEVTRNRLVDKYAKTRAVLDLYDAPVFT